MGFSRRNTGVGCHALLRAGRGGGGCLPDQGWNLCLVGLVRWQAGSVTTAAAGAAGPARSQRPVHRVSAPRPTALGTSRLVRSGAGADGVAMECFPHQPHVLQGAISTVQRQKLGLRELPRQRRATRLAKGSGRIGSSGSWCSRGLS